MIMESKDIRMRRIWRAIGDVNKAIDSRGKKQAESLISALQNMALFIQNEPASDDPVLSAQRERAIAMARETLAKARGES